MSEGKTYRLDKIKELLGKPLIKNTAIVFVSLAMFILTWWGVALWLDLAYLPTPDNVYRALIVSFSDEDPILHITMWQNIFTSLQRFIWGFLISFVIAVPVGMIMGCSKTFELLSKPIIEVFRPIPPIAWVPFFIIALHYYWGPVMVIFMGVFFPLVSNIYFGVKSVEPILLDAARTQGASRFQMFTKVIFPYTIPFLLTGIRIGMGIGWMCIVAAEMIGGHSGGIGFYITTMGELSLYDNMFAGMIVIAVLGLMTTGLMQYLENVVNKRMGIR
jgi:ABC-type nitrate/sulfonate/bicarbonate transport system permease component